METASEQHHVIGSMRMDFRLTDPSLGRDVQEKLSQLACKNLMPAMEAVFTEVCSPDETHRLERLVVDLGTVPLAHLEEEILARFTPLLQQALGDALRSSPEGDASVDTRAAGSHESSSLALFEHLLQHGALPWWAGAQSGSSLEDLFMELVVSERVRMEQVIRRLVAWQQVRLRLIRQFSPTALSALVVLLEPNDAPLILKFLEQMDDPGQKTQTATGTREFHESKWDHVIHTLLKKHGTRLNMKVFLRRLQKNTDAKGTRAKHADRLSEHSKSLRPTVPGDSHYVDNAGLVILSPFFGMLYEKHGLLEEGRFRDHVAAERGVHLLQSLLIEEAAVPEQALVLNKVLCGLTPDIPVLHENGLVEQDRTHTQMLLRSAIQNWPVLNNVSIDGFRGSFLWRSGKLTRGEDRWTLTIEHRGFDVLMSSMPWSFAVIKPLWMPDPLYVDWV